MGLPATALFSAVLESMRRIGPLDRPGEQISDGFNVLELRPNSRGYRLADGRSGEIHSIQIRYRPSDGLTLDAIRDRIQKELQQRGHSESEPIAGCVLAIATLAHPNERLTYLNTILDSVTTADLTQIVVLPTLNELKYRVRFGSFEIAPLDLDRLRYRSERAGSDFFELWGDRLARRLAIERDFHQVKVIPFPTSSPLVRGSNIAEFRELVDHYFSEVAVRHFDDFWLRWREDQELLNAMDTAYFPERIFRYFPGTDNVSVFANIGGTGHGWVSPGAQMLELNLARTDTRVPAALQQLRDEYAFEGFGAGELDTTLRSYVRMLARARQHMHEGLRDEAVLHLVIALDLLFGERDASTRNVSARASAACTAAQISLYSESARRIGRLYDARSRYVHQGQPFPSEVIAVAEETCATVLRVLLRLHRRAAVEQDTIKLESWLAALDFVKAAAIAGVEIEPEFLGRWGLRESKKADEDSSKPHSN